MKWAIPMIEGNDLILDNYQNFIRRFRHNFSDPIWRITVSWEIWKPKQRNKKVSLFISDFKLLAWGVGWNEMALIQFRVGLNDDA